MVSVVLICIIRIFADNELMNQIYEFHVLSAKKSFKLPIVSVVFGREVLWR